MKESYEMHALRSMAWERAKGELASMRHTYYEDNRKYKEYVEKVQRFIESIEDNQLHA